MSRGRKGYYLLGDKKDKKYYMAQRKKEREARLLFIAKYLGGSRMLTHARLSFINNFSPCVEKFLYQYSNETDLSPTTLSSVFRQGFSNHIPRFMVNPSILSAMRRAYSDGTFINIFPISKNTFSNSYSRVNNLMDCMFACWDGNHSPVVDTEEYNSDSMSQGAEIPKIPHIGKNAILKLIGYCKVFNIQAPQVTYDIDISSVDNETFKDCGKALGYVVDIMLSSIFSNFTFSQEIIDNKSTLIPKLRESITSSLINLVGILDYKSLKMVITSNVISILLSVTKVNDDIIDKWRLPNDYIEGMFSYALNYEDKEDNTKVNDDEDD